jgi:hypothetical protein
MRQSIGQLKGFSPGPQKPSPHRVQKPQSAWHVEQLSPWNPSQIPLPQKPQSKGHDAGVSPKVHAPSPQRGGVRQSIGQVKAVSVGPQIASPQKPMLPQSIGHVPRGPDSPGSQMRFPQTLRLQSLGQLLGVSPGSQNPLPQKKPQSRGQV